MDIHVNHTHGRSTPPASADRAARRGAERANGTRPVVSPPVDILENSNEILLIADVPGASTQGLSVTVDRGLLSIEARTSPIEGTSLLRERVDADYGRVFRLPREVNSDGIVASLKDGVLSIRVPKREAATSRRIPVTMS